MPLPDGSAVAPPGVVVPLADDRSATSEQLGDGHEPILVLTLDEERFEGAE